LFNTRLSNLAKPPDSSRKDYRSAMVESNLTGAEAKPFERFIAVVKWSMGSPSESLLKCNCQSTDSISQLSIIERRFPRLGGRFIKAICDSVKDLAGFQGAALAR
jgi:hypothetical protein